MIVSSSEKISTNLFTHECRKWRQFRKLSQLDLALAANISQRHLSYLETGRSRPSRDMVIQLSDAMDVPLRDRNLLLKAAGYAAQYRESGLSEPAMKPVMQAIERALAHHNPLPAIVIDRFWDIQMTNTSADRLFELVSANNVLFKQSMLSGRVNIAELTLHPEGLKPYITNWQQALPLFIQRLKREIVSSNDPEVRERLAGFIQLAKCDEQSECLQPSLLPVIPLNVKLGDIELSLFSMISTIGTAQDVTADELRIESFYPNDEATDSFFKGQPSSTGFE